MPNSTSNNANAGSNGNGNGNGMAEANEKALMTPDISSPGVNTPSYILEGTHNFSIPTAFVEGTAPPLTSKPYQLSRGYQHLVESPDQYKAVITEKLGKLQSTLGQLGSDDLRQAKADIVYLRSVLDGEGVDLAQVRAGAVWASRDV